MVTVALGPDELDPQPAASAGTSATSNDESGTEAKGQTRHRKLLAGDGSRP